MYDKDIIMLQVSQTYNVQLYLGSLCSTFSYPCLDTFLLYPLLNNRFMNRILIEMFLLPQGGGRSNG